VQAVVLAGGRGTRLGTELPKPLVPLAGAPVLVHVLAWLARHGVTEAILCTGYRAETIEAEIGDGARFGLRVRYSVESTPLGTAGAVKAAEAMLRDRFVVAYGDVIADVDLEAMLQAHLASDALATLAVHPNSHPFDSDRVVADPAGRIVRMVKKEERAGIEAGGLCSAALYIVERRLVAGLQPVSAGAAPVDFARDVFPALVGRGERLLAHRTTEYLKDMGTPDRRARVEADVRAGVPARMRRSAFRPAVLLDRDGVLNEDVPFIRAPDQLRLLPEAAPALRKLNQSHVLAVCCTNQPVVARGEVTEAELAAIHRHLEGMLGETGAWLDALYVCPHHPDRGYPGERAELKIRCTCRKPQPGLILDAVRDLGIDRRRSIFVGDRTIDLRAAHAAGVLGVGVLTGKALHDGLLPLPPETPIVESVSEAVDLLLVTAPSCEPLVDEALARRVVLIGGPSRAGKTVAASALRLALQARGADVVHLSLDRFIEPLSARRPGAPFRERIGMAAATEAVRTIVQGGTALCPGYDPATRERGPSELFRHTGRGVLLVEGLLALDLDVDGAARLAVVADPASLAARRAAFHAWKARRGPIGPAADYERSRQEEDEAVAASTAAATARLALGSDRRLAPVT
jgi:histidinol-phosphate phosphatase family protein